MQLGQLRQDLGLVDLGSRSLSLLLIALLGALRPPLELGLSFGLLVAVPLELAEGRSPP
jgi:hypothetical protein